MPYIITKKNGKRFKATFMLTASDVANLARDPANCYVVKSPVTMRSKRVGGACKKRRGHR